MNDLVTLADLLAILCGLLVGFSLALIGGGGSILATPLLLYVVGVRDPHLAIGTTAVPVIGVVASAIALHEPLGVVQIAALLLTLGGIVLATRS